MCATRQGTAGAIAPHLHDARRVQADEGTLWDKLTQSLSGFWAATIRRGSHPDPTLAHVSQPIGSRLCWVGTGRNYPHASAVISTSCRIGQSIGLWVNLWPDH